MIETGHLDTAGNPLRTGDTVQAVVDPGIGTNRERWFGWIESSDDTHVFVRLDCWYDIAGDRHDLRGAVVRVAPSILRRLYVSADT